MPRPALTAGFFGFRRLDGRCRLSAGSFLLPVICLMLPIHGWSGAGLAPCHSQPQDEILVPVTSHRDLVGVDPLPPRGITQNLTKSLSLLQQSVNQCCHRLVLGEYLHRQIVAGRTLRHQHYVPDLHSSEYPASKERCERGPP